MRIAAIGLATLASALLLQGFQSAEAAGKRKGKGGSGDVAMESITIVHEGFDSKKPQGGSSDGKYVNRKIPGRAKAGR